MKMCIYGVAAAFGLTLLAANPVRADTLNIPAAAARTGSTLTPSCDAQFGVDYISGHEACYVEFPISVPVGHSIQQIAILHSTDNSFLFPLVTATLQVTHLSPLSTSPEFSWISVDPVFTGSVDDHKLMSEIVSRGGTVYVDQFVVEPKTMYSVILQLQNGAAVEGVEITYH